MNNSNQKTEIVKGARIHFLYVTSLETMVVERIYPRSFLCRSLAEPNRTQTFNRLPNQNGTFSVKQKSGSYHISLDDRVGYPNSMRCLAVDEYERRMWHRYKRHELHEWIRTAPVEVLKEVAHVRKVFECKAATTATSAAPPAGQVTGPKIECLGGTGR